MTEAPPGGQDWIAATYARNAAFVPALGADVLALLAPKPGERIVDVGCGDGVLTARIVAAGAELLMVGFLSGCRSLLAADKREYKPPAWECQEKETGPRFFFSQGLGITGGGAPGERARRGRRRAPRP